VVFYFGGCMERFFEKIDYEEFKKYYGDDKELYDSYKLPVRATKCSAGYDFLAIKGFTIKPGEIKKIPTGYKAHFLKDEMLMLFVRSSMGYKYNVRMCNQVGIIESDYCNNPQNGGHMFVALQNEGDKDFVVEENEAYTQAVFTKFLITDDDNVKNIREGGIGSTTKKGNDK
jgi:dUTP pyrophosphatase